MDIYKELYNKIEDLNVSRPLKPCPFCGNRADRWINDNGDIPFIVHGCMTCGEEFWGDEGEWNTRPMEDYLESKIHELEKRLEELKAGGM